MMPRYHKTLVGYFGRDCTASQGGEAAIAASGTRLWLATGLGCRRRDTALLTSAQ